ncbi:MAG TPA: hypothetical protein VHU23_18255 [Rhizomicrobium sp.]|jgi:hypothetical protein|nr:hypothetical protein [Rhizomicrobium sp.]
MGKAAILSDSRLRYSGLKSAPIAAARLPEVMADSLPHSEPATQIFPYKYGFLHVERLE